MRVGLSFDLDRDAPPPEVWRAAIGEAVTADGLGYDSVWVTESRASAGSCPSPSLLLTHLARRTSSIQLRSVRRIAHPVRLAEEIAVLDLFSRGRAGAAFVVSGGGGPVGEGVDFVLTAWTADEFRFRGSFLRFPAHTGDDAPAGASLPPPSAETYVPQWERGPATPDFLSVTPKPFNPRPPVWVQTDDSRTLRWAAARGIAPFLSADLPEEEAATRASDYRAHARSAGRACWSAEIVIERRFDPDRPRLAEWLRALTKTTGATHLVWRRTAEQWGRTDQLVRFASEIHPLLQT